MAKWRISESVKRSGGSENGINGENSQRSGINMTYQQRKSWQQRINGMAA